MMRLDVVWVPAPNERDGDRVSIARASGFEAAALAEVVVPRGVTVKVGRGGYGKGAEGSGIALILEVAERVLVDGAAFYAVGQALKTLVHGISDRRHGHPAAADAMSLAALAAVDSETIAEHPEQWLHARTIPLTSDGSIGMASTDIWASVFLNDARDLMHVVFASSSTRYLGSVLLPTAEPSPNADRESLVAQLMEARRALVCSALHLEHEAAREHLGIAIEDLGKG
jgi:hypothetical protein